MTRHSAHDHMRVLLAEADPDLALELQAALSGAGFLIDGPHPTLADSMAAIAHHVPDCAVIDAALGNRDSALLADDLGLYGIPFVLCSAERPSELMAAQFSHHIWLQGEAAGDQVVPALKKIIG